MKLIKQLKTKQKLNKLKERLTVFGATIISTFIMANTRVLAASNTESIDSFINFACDWLTKIGGVIALVGGVMFALRLAKRRCRGKISWFNDTYGRVYASCNCSI